MLNVWGLPDFISGRPCGRHGKRSGGAAGDVKIIEDPDAPSCFHIPFIDSAIYIDSV